MIFFWAAVALIGVVLYLLYEFSVYDKKMAEITSRLQSLVKKFETFEDDGR